MKNISKWFAVVLGGAAAMTWLGFFISFTNVTNRQPGGWQFGVGSGLILIAGCGLGCFFADDLRRKP